MVRFKRYGWKFHWKFYRLGKGIDWWCLGVFLYELNAGFSPFHAADQTKLYTLILRCGKRIYLNWSIIFFFFILLEYKFPKHFQEDLKSLVRNLLQIDTTKRFGCLANGADDIKNHSYFQRINWVSLYEKKIPSDYKPQLNRTQSFEYFEAKKDFQIPKSSICLFEKEFQDF